MSTHTCPRPGCDRQTMDAYVCAHHGRQLARELRELAGLAGEVRTTIARLDRHGGGGRRAPGDWMPNLAASDRLADVAYTVCSTATWIAGQRGTVVPGVDRAREPLQLAARWLATQTDWLRGHPEGPARYTALSRACATVRHLVDSPPERVYLGPCSVPDRHGADCETDLYGRPGSDYATCLGCGIQHAVADRRAWLQDLVRGYAYTAADISSAYGIPAGTIRAWASRGQLTSTGHDRYGRRCYALGAVLDLAAAAAARRATSHARRQRASRSAA